MKSRSMYSPRGYERGPPMNYQPPQLGGPPWEPHHDRVRNPTTIDEFIDVYAQETPDRGPWQRQYIKREPVDDYGYPYSNQQGYSSCHYHESGGRRPHWH